MSPVEATALPGAVRRLQRVSQDPTLAAFSDVGLDHAAAILGRRPRRCGSQHEGAQVARDEELSELGGDEEFESEDKLEDLDELNSYRDLGDETIDEGDADGDAPGDTTTTGGEDSSATPEIDETDEEEEESLEALLGTDETVTEASPRVAGARAPEGIGEDEFTCRSCFLVKSRAQLADTDQLICSDCA